MTKHAGFPGFGSVARPEYLLSAELALCFTHGRSSISDKTQGNHSWCTFAQPALTGISITLVEEKGLFLSPPPPMSGTIGPIYEIQTALDRPGKFIEGNPILLTSRSPMTSQVKSESKCLTICRS